MKTALTSSPASTSTPTSLNRWAAKLPAPFENYKRAKEEFVAMLEADRKWREAIQRELDRALSDYFEKR